MKPKLDDFETQIEKSDYVPVSAQKRASIDALLERTKKTKNVNIRISELDLSLLRELSERNGIPYQTLIASVLHKYVTNQLVEEKDILRALQLVEKG
jgi:predicted DNA binding CopG/RHH family protein